MYRPHLSPAPRKGIILLVVLALLTLFTIVGISFVLYADAAATNARSAKEAALPFRADMDPEKCLSLFLDQLIFDVRDDESGVYSGLRGHSLTRSVYGFDYTWGDLTPTVSASTVLAVAITSTTATTIDVQAVTGFPTAPYFLIQVDSEIMLVTAMTGTTWTVVRANHGTIGATHAINAPVTTVRLPNEIVQVGNDVPFIGTGRLHHAFQGAAPLVDPTTGQLVDDYKLVNYTWFQSDGFLRDPERFGVRNALRTSGSPDNRGPYLGGFNVSYTYPDLNNFYLGAIDGNGNLLTPSFHREWLFGRLDDTANPNWTNAVGKYLTPRPRPTEHPNFPRPADRGGDVKNLIGYPGGNDSIWIDINAPVLTAPDGRKYKMLVAPLIIELDGRVNVNAHGNVVGRQGGQRQHHSNHGLGPWEVNLSRILTANDGGGQPEWPHLFLGRNSSPRMLGKYGPWQPPPSNLPPEPVNNATAMADTAPGIPQPRFYAQLNYLGDAQARVTMPTTAPPMTMLSAFPTYPPTYLNANAAERLHHPLLYNIITPYGPRMDTSFTPPRPSEGWNRRFRASNMERFFRWNDTGMESLTSELERLLPYNFNNPADLPGSFRRRNLITTDSGERNEPGSTVGIYQDTAPYTINPLFPDRPPVGQPVVYPDPTNAAQRAPRGEFGGDWRSALARRYNRLDCNNPIPNATTPTSPLALAAYPTTNPGPNTTTQPTVRFDTSTSMSATNATTYADQFLRAQSERQYFARQMYERLLAVTGVQPVATPATPTDADLMPRRWLAQLAVNMIDYMDNDNISTPFNFYTLQDAGGAMGFNPGELMTTTNAQGEANPRYWVFGTELPRVVLNEVLAEYTPPAIVAPATAPMAGDRVTNKVWVELYNPMEVVPTGTNLNQSDDNQIPLFQPKVLPAQQMGAVATIPSNTGEYPTYQVVVADKIMPSLDNSNVLGLSNIERTRVDADFTAGPGSVKQIDGGGSTSLQAHVQRKGFLLVAPPGTDKNKTVAAFHATNFPNGSVPATTRVLHTAKMEYNATHANATTLNAPDDQIIQNGMTVLLRRLANPHIPPDPRPTVGNAINPWYNPYITTDYIEHVENYNNETAGQWKSRGKVQPYASRFIPRDATSPTKPHATSLVIDQTVSGGMTSHSFGQQNNLPARSHYDWLPHMDRVLISPAELLHVSQFQPHQLTQRFMLADDANVNNRFQHAPLTSWYDETHRLYRLFEFLDVRDRALGAVDNGRTSGKININAIWDYETFLALCDPRPANGAGPNDFDETDVQRVWNQLIAQRSPNFDPVVPTRRVPGPTNIAQNQTIGNRPNDRPFLGYAPVPRAANPALYAQTPEAEGINNTFLRADSGGTGRLFEFTPASGTAHPFARTQLLSKIFNNVTTRSNVFAVWVTVGFFEVTNETTRPVTLGAEMGSADGKQVRHRMFAIVDRSVLPANPHTAAMGVPLPKTPFRPSSPPSTPIDMRGLVPHYAIID